MSDTTTYYINKYLTNLLGDYIREWEGIYKAFVISDKVCMIPYWMGINFGGNKTYLYCQWWPYILA